MKFYITVACVLFILYLLYEKYTMPKYLQTVYWLSKKGMQYTVNKSTWTDTFGQRQTYKDGMLFTSEEKALAKKAKLESKYIRRH